MSEYNESTHTPTPRVFVLSQSNLRESPKGSRHYFEYATIRFPAGQLVKRTDDHTETALPCATEVNARRRVRKYDWKPLGPWTFVYCNRSRYWEEPK